MKILIVEDDDDKRTEITTFMRSRYAADEVASARSFQSGLRAIIESEPDFIILDMTMRNFDRTIAEDGGRPHPFAGREILRQMHRLRIRTPVLIVTHFDRFGEESDLMTLEELKAELSARFENYVGTVQYKSNVDSWQAGIAAAIGDQLQQKSGDA